MVDPRPLENIGHNPFVRFIRFSLHVSLSTCSKKINACYRNITDISPVIRIRYLKRGSVSLGVLDKSVHLLWNLLKMRNELRLDRVSGFTKSIFLGCLLSSLASRISAQDEKKTFESVFGLDRPKFADNSRQLHGETDSNIGDASVKKTAEELEDLIDDGDISGDIDEGKEDEISSNVDVVSEPKNEITYSEGISGRAIGEKSGKYVRYGECFDIDGRDHYFFTLCFIIRDFEVGYLRVGSPGFSFLFFVSVEQACV